MQQPVHFTHASGTQAKKAKEEAKRLKMEAAEQKKRDAKGLATPGLGEHQFHTFRYEIQVPWAVADGVAPEDVTLCDGMQVEALYHLQPLAHRTVYYPGYIAGAEPF